MSARCDWSVQFQMLLLTALVLVMGRHGFAAKKDYEANRDLLIIVDTTGGLSRIYKTYTKSVMPDEKDLWATAENTCLFQLWLMYLGPWKFDIHDNPLAIRELGKLPKSGCARVALNSPLVSDPLEILPTLNKGAPIEKCLPPVGRWPNLNVEAIHSKEQYTTIIASYKAWLAGGNEK
jgi:hypothetical protein